MRENYGMCIFGVSPRRELVLHGFGQLIELLAPMKFSSKQELRALDYLE